MPTHRKGIETPQMADEYRAGATTVELGRKYDMSPAAVNGRLRRAGVPIREAARRTRYQTDEAFVLQVATLYRAGETTGTLATKFGVGRMTITRSLARAKVQIRRNGTRAATVRVPTDPLMLGYLAGLFDGEGNLQFKSARHGGRVDSIGCKIAIYSTTASVMGWLKNNIGGHVRWDYTRQERHGWLPCGSWEVYRAQDVLALLSAMLPILLVKRKAATRAIKHLSDKCGR